MYVGAPKVNLLFNVFVCGVAVPRGHRHHRTLLRRVGVFSQRKNP